MKLWPKMKFWTVDKTLWVETQRMKVTTKEKGPISQEHQSSKLEPVLFILVMVVMRHDWVM
jgi:hypothetical protein